MPQGEDIFSTRTRTASRETSLDKNILGAVGDPLPRRPWVTFPRGKVTFKLKFVLRSKTYLIHRPQAEKTNGFGSRNIGNKTASCTRAPSVALRRHLPPGGRQGRQQNAPHIPPAGGANARRSLPVASPQAATANRTSSPPQATRPVFACRRRGKITKEIV